MLVLSRRLNETIVINDNIRVTVVEIRGDRVRLGITAPREVPVHREEVYQAIYGRRPVDRRSVRPASSPQPEAAESEEPRSNPETSNEPAQP
jgi:carbon storage regulator